MFLEVGVPAQEMEGKIQTQLCSQNISHRECLCLTEKGNTEK